jgi:hypothetical protein
MFLFFGAVRSVPFLASIFGFSFFQGIFVFISCSENLQ